MSRHDLARQHGYAFRPGAFAAIEGLRPRRRGIKKELVGVVARQLVLDLQFFLLQLVEKVFVGMRPMLFFVDHGVERLVLGVQSLDLGLVHRCNSFRDQM